MSWNGSRQRLKSEIICSTVVKELSLSIRLAVFRPLCKLCGINLVYADEGVICRECVSQVIPIAAPICRHCGRPSANQHHVCGECIVRPPIYRKHISYSIYEGVLKEMIRLFKYREIKILKHLFAGYYVQMMKQQIKEDFDFVVPAPVDKSRKRDFYPVYEIAKILSKETGIHVWKKCLVKTRATEPQARLSRNKRLHNLDGVIQVTQAGRLAGKKVLLIDDVYTTGTTIKKCCESLVEAKADVVALTLARSM